MYFLFHMIASLRSSKEVNTVPAQPQPWDVHQQQTVSHKKMQNEQISLCVRVVLAPERSSASCS